MAHFDINPLDTGELKLDPGKSRKVVFNVKNTTGKEVKARANVLPRDKEPSGDGGKGEDPVSYAFDDKTYVFSPDEQHQITVNLSASKDAGAGRHGFKLLVYNVDDPNVEYGESELQSIEIKEPVPPPPTRWGLILALLGGLVVVAGGVVAFILLTGNGTVAVPGVVGKAYEEAQRILLESGLEVEQGEPRITGESENGFVLEQDPPAGKEVEKGTVVQVIVEGKSVLVPVCKGLAFKDAASNLEAVGLNPQRGEEKLVDKPAGQVVGQDPEAGKRTAAGVDVVLAVAADGVKVPRITRKDPLTATKMLGDAGLSTGKVTERGRATGDDVVVFVSGSDPKPGTLVHRGSVVDLVITRKKKGGGGFDITNVLTTARERTELAPLLRFSPAPQPVSPKDGQVFKHFPRKTTLKWKPVPGAKSYTVEIQFGQPGGGSWKALRTAPNIQGTSHTFNFIGAQPGRWRVWAVLEGGKSTGKSAWKTFRYTR